MRFIYVCQAIELRDQQANVEGKGTELGFIPSNWTKSDSIL